MSSATKPAATLFAADVSGDVVVEATRLNTKGGSMSATLKKALRAAFEGGGDIAIGARLDFGDRGSVVLLAPSGGDDEHGTHRIRVTRMHDRRFLVDWVDDEVEADDPMTQAFLSLIIEQFKRGDRQLVDREAALAELDEIVSQSAELPKE